MARPGGGSGKGTRSGFEFVVKGSEFFRDFGAANGFDVHVAQLRDGQNIPVAFLQPAYLSADSSIRLSRP